MNKSKISYPRSYFSPHMAQIIELVFIHHYVVIDRAWKTYFIKNDFHLVNTIEISKRFNNLIQIVRFQFPDLGCQHSRAWWNTQAENLIKGAIMWLSKSNKYKNLNWEKYFQHDNIYLGELLLASAKVLAN